MADPGFPIGAVTPKGAPTYYLTNFFPENYMIMKKILPSVQSIFAAIIIICTATRLRDNLLRVSFLTVIRLY